LEAHTDEQIASEVLLPDVAYALRHRTGERLEVLARLEAEMREWSK
jgi:hypothetical protein